MTTTRDATDVSSGREGSVRRRQGRGGGKAARAEIVLTRTTTPPGFRAVQMATVADPSGGVRTVTEGGVDVEAGALGAHGGRMISDVSGSDRRGHGIAPQRGQITTSDGDLQAQRDGEGEQRGGRGGGGGAARGEAIGKVIRVRIRAPMGQHAGLAFVIVARATAEAQQVQGIVGRHGARTTAARQLGAVTAPASMRTEFQHVGMGLHPDTVLSDHGDLTGGGRGGSGAGRGHGRHG
jgi:hypothetical protein